MYTFLKHAIWWGTLPLATCRCTGQSALGRELLAAPLIWVLLWKLLLIFGCAECQGDRPAISALTTLGCNAASVQHWSLWRKHSCLRKILGQGYRPEITTPLFTSVVEHYKFLPSPSTSVSGSLNGEVVVVWKTAFPTFPPTGLKVGIAKGTFLTCVLTPV